MSKVDLTPFKTLAEKVERKYDAGFLYSVFNGYINQDKVKALNIDYSLEECKGGEEGGGEVCWGVIKLDDKYYRAYWSYYSYNGSEYDWIENTIEEVVPREVTVTQFFPV